MARTFNATVVQTSPKLLISVDADEATQIPAIALSSYTPAVGHHVRCEDRAPMPPIIQGRI